MKMKTFSRWIRLRLVRSRAGTQAREKTGWRDRETTEGRHQRSLSFGLVRFSERSLARGMVRGERCISQTNTTTSSDLKEKSKIGLEH